MAGSPFLHENCQYGSPISIKKPAAVDYYERRKGRRRPDKWIIMESVNRRTQG
ncbi:Hypothetical predicted protein [Podarcis lilfordi]|uniref:Uncharacterized protein n=1 Tax=Podarcis lilfordi TaxID=74358 RepID=A0AA35KK17_9SAUR|nr:Hypothetical predicted protein [Podarcis lilfordi]